MGLFYFLISSQWQPTERVWLTKQTIVSCRIANSQSSFTQGMRKKTTRKDLAMRDNAPSVTTDETGMWGK